MILVTSCAKAWQSQGLEATTIQVGHACYGSTHGRPQGSPSIPHLPSSLPILESPILLQIEELAQGTTPAPKWLTGRFFCRIMPTFIEFIWLKVGVTRIFHREIFLSGVNFMCYHLPGCLIRNFHWFLLLSEYPCFDIWDLSEGFSAKNFQVFWWRGAWVLVIWCRRTHWVCLVFQSCAGSGSRAYGIGSQIYASVIYPFSVHMLSCSRSLHLSFCMEDGSTS